MIEQKIHLNKPQLRSAMIFAPEEWAVWARGTGKTKGLIAPKSAAYLDMMPRCVGVFVAATFQQILTRTLPPVIAGWEKLGYKQGVHFLVGQKPPHKWRDMWRWEGPYHAPFNFEYFISWWNGAGIQLISQDRPGSSNGMSIDFIMGDEAKLLNEQRLKEELFPANRGIHRELVNNPHHHGKTFTTDMPVGTAGRWILNKQKDMDIERYQAIVTVLGKVHELNNELNVCKNKERAKQISKKLISADSILNVLRRNFVYYHEASAIDNIDALGIDYIKEELRSLSKFEFSTAIMNIKPIKLEDGFYPHLDEEQHGYFSYDYHHFNKIGYDFSLLQQFNDCRKDGDLIPGQALHIAIDYNRRIWPIVTGQPVMGKGINELRTLSGQHVLYPKSIQDAIVQWNDYYKYHDTKVVYFWFDHTALNETRKPVRDDIVEKLRELGWIVIEKYIGQALAPEIRYNVFSDILRENGKYPWRLRFNRDNCKYLLLSMFQAQAIENERGYKKNKSSERDKKFPAEESTHYSDAYDTLVYGICISDIGFIDAGNDFVGIELR
jgi:hypothetical protein